MEDSIIIIQEEDRAIACISKPEIVAPGTNIVATNAMKGEDDRPYTVKQRRQACLRLWYLVQQLFIGTLSQNDKYKCEAKSWKSAKNLGLPRSHQGWGQLDMSHLLE